MGFVEPEIDFPRGGADQNIHKTEKRKNAPKRKNEETLFGDGSKKPKTDKNQKKTKKKGDTEELKKPTVWTKPITSDLLSEGVMGLGVVREIYDDHLLLETVDNCRVRLPATEIGKMYTNLLKSEATSLEDTFDIGQMIPFRVIHRASETTVGGKKTILSPEVTSDPTKLNSHLVPSQLTSGLVIHSIIESSEEKGYVLDIGLAAKGFLPIEKAPATSLTVGNPLLVRIESATARVVKVSSFVEQDTLSREACDKLHINHLMPGTIIECDPIVEETHASGVFVNLGNGIRGFVARKHLPPRLRVDISRLVKSFRGVVMFCQQNSNLLVISAHPDIVAISKPEKRRDFDGLEIGDKTVGTVLEVNPGRFTVTFLLPPSSDGKASLITAKASKAYLDQAEKCAENYKISSEHELRVIDFRYAERSLIVTTRKDILKQKMVSYKDAVPGDLVKAKVVQPNSKGVNATIFDSIRGFMPLHLISDKAVDIAKSYPIGKEFNCRILNINPEKKTVTLTAKPSLVKHKGVKINSYSTDFVGKTTVGTITKIFPGGALLVAFYNRVFGVIPGQEAKKLGKKAVLHKDICVKVTSVDEENGKMQLLLSDDKSSIEEVQKETVQEVTPKNTPQTSEEQPDKKSEVSLKKSVKNFKIYTATVIGTWNFEEAGSHFCAKIRLPGNQLGRLHVSELPEKYFKNKNILSTFISENVDKKVVVKVIGFTALHIGTHEKLRVADLTMNSGKIANLQLKAKKMSYSHNYQKGDIVKCFVSPGNASAHVKLEISPICFGLIPRELLVDDMLINSTVEGGLINVEEKCCAVREAIVTGVSKQKSKIVLNLKPFEKNEEEQHSKKKLKNSLFEFGQPVTGRILNINHPNISVGLSTGQQAILGPTGVSEKYERVNEHLKKFHKGELYRFHCLRRDEEPRRYYVITEGRYSQYEKNPNSEEPTVLMKSLSDVEKIIGKSVWGFLCYNSGPSFSLVEIAPGIHGAVKKNEIVKNLPLNSVLSVKVKSVDLETKKVRLSFEKVIFTPNQLIQQEKNHDEKLSDKASSDIPMVQNEEESGEMIQMEDPGFDWENVGFTADELAAVGKIEHSTNSKESVRKLSKDVKLKSTVYQNEEAHGSEEDFNRTLRKDPNSAAIWIKYMSHFLEKNDLEKARATAERALTVINYREEAEIFNIWTAYLNMEVAFGDEASVKAVFERACNNADSLKIHKQMAAIFVANEKVEEADEIFNVMIRKFRASSDDVWYLYADHLMSTERAQEGRDLLQRALASVPKATHAQLISRFAQLEYNKGDAERGCTLFESLITAYPKKTDLWMVYADLSLKYSGIETARQVLERACNLPLNMHKLRPLFKKWMEFEEKHGDDQSRQLVRSHAQRYLQSQDLE